MPPGGGVGVSVGVEVLVGVFVGATVFVFVAVGVRVGVFVMVGVLVAVGVLVGEPGVFVGTTGVFVGVLLGVTGTVGVGEGNGVPEKSTSSCAVPVLCRACK